MSTPSPFPRWHLYVPKLVTVLRQGYGPGDFRQDVIAGLTVAIVALPLAMALAIASGVTPDKGLTTVIVAGLLISALGGSRFQIGGPTGAFVVVVFGVVAEYGYEGLVVATLMAGAMLIVAGLMGLGTWIKYIPGPVVTGFTSGIAVIIALSQVKDLLGLDLDVVPGEFFERLAAYGSTLASTNPLSVAISVGGIATILLLRRYAPKMPGFLIAVALATIVTALWSLPVDTIGSRFGELPSGLPKPSWPDMSWPMIRELLPSAFTIAFLAGVESLLSAVVADTMTGRRHRSDCELVAQGVANVSSAVFGGIPATGAIARTATSIRSGARSPLAGVLHALFVLLFVLVAAPLASRVPLASLAAVLIIVAWNMSEIDRFRFLMRAPRGDRLVLLLTFGLTVVFDLTIAIAVGVVLAAIQFMHTMANAVAVRTQSSLIERDVDDFSRAPAERVERRKSLPAGVELVELRGPFFFGVATRLVDFFTETGRIPPAIILLMQDVPLIDATGAGALDEFVTRCRRNGTRLIVAGMGAEVHATLSQMAPGLARSVESVPSYEAALALLVDTPDA